MGALAVLGREGDTKIIWDPENEAEVDNARRSFDALRGKGYLAYAVTGRGKKGEVVREFDAEAEKLILAPPMQGG